MTEHHTKVLILGSGPAGSTAAIYAARAGLNPMLVHGMQPGGQLTITTDVENYPGFADVIQGPWLMQQMEEQARKSGTEIVHDHIETVDLSKRPFTLTGQSGDVYKAESLIICTGAQAKWLGHPAEEAYSGFGVSACATCDGPFYKDKIAVVIGGGNTAVEEALHLSHIAKEVHLVHRRDELRAEKILQERLFAKENVTIHWNRELDDIIGKDEPFKHVTGIKLKSTVDDATEEFDTDGIFIAIGHKPNTELFKGQLDMKDNGYLITKTESTATNTPGVFAAGDVHDDKWRQAVTAAGDGCRAAIEVGHFLAEQEDQQKDSKAA